MRRRRGREPPDHSAGIALVAVLWSVVLLTLMATMVLSLQRTRSHVARRFIDTALAEAAADSALNLTLLRIGTRDDSAPGQHAALDLHPPAFIQSIAVSIQRERERVDLNAAGPETLAACFAGAGFSADTALSMAARVIDWRDADDVAGPGGAEEADYHAAGLRYGPRNGPFQSVEELRQVLGMDTLHGAVLGRFTVYTHRGDDDIGALAEDLAASASTSVPRCGGSRGGGGPLTGASGRDDLIGEVVRIRACATERVRLCRLVVARLTGSLHNPFQVFIWRTQGAQD